MTVTERNANGGEPLRNVEALKNRDAILTAMVDAAQLAQGPLRKAYYANKSGEKPLIVRVKGDGTKATDADDESQNTVVKRLKKLTEVGEDIDFFAEEKELNLQKDRVAQHRFVIDPLDGTTVFINGTHDQAYFGISIADMDPDGKIVRSVIMDGETGNMLIGISDEDPNIAGVYFIPAGTGEMKKLLKDEAKHLEKRTMAVHKNRDELPTLKKIDESLSGKNFTIENKGSLVTDLSQFVQGEYRAVINGACFWWDIAAAKHMIALQGLTLVDWEGNEPQFNTENPRAPMRILACHPDDLPSLQEVIAGAKNATIDQ